MALCTDAAFVNANRHEGEVSLLRCKKWDCEVCRPFNRMKVMNAARRGKPNVFMTLTSRKGSFSTPDEAARDMKRGLVLLRRRIKRKWGIEKVPFLVVFERTKQGWPHMHLLMRASYMHWRVLRAMWEDITGSHQVDVRFIKKHTQVLFYVTKYIGKDLAAFEGCKRWWRSHNYNVVEDDPYTPIKWGPWYEKISIPWGHVVIGIEESGADFEKIGKYRYRWRWEKPGQSGLPWIVAAYKNQGQHACLHVGRGVGA